MKNKKIINRIIDIAILLPFAYFPKYNILHTKLELVFEAYSIFVFMIIAILFFRKKGFKIPTIILLIGLMYFVPFIVTATYGDHQMIRYAIKILLGNVSLALLISYNIPDRTKEFLQSSILFFGALVFINTMTFFLYYPSMISEQLSYYFLGNDNGTIYETFIFIYLSLVYFNMYKEKIPIYFYLIVIFIFSGYFYVKSGNGMVCMIITILFMLLYKYKYVKFFLKLRFMIPIFLALFFTIVIFRNNGLIQLVMNILDKNPTISGRTVIWDKCWQFIGQHPILGNGYENEILMEYKVDNSKLHNVILQYLYNGGVVALTLFLTVVGMVLNKIKASKLDDDIKNIMNFSIFLFFVISIFDFYVVKFTMIFMFLIYYFIATTTKDQIKKGAGNEKSKRRLSKN